jgi:hypothetical protein
MAPRISRFGFFVGGSSSSFSSAMAHAKRKRPNVKVSLAPVGKANAEKKDQPKGKASNSRR